jgi:hypothetical protein
MQFQRNTGLPLHNIGRPRIEPIVRATTGRVCIEVRGVARKLANGALQAPKRVAAIFTATSGDAVSFADVDAQDHGNDETKYSQDEA